MQLKDIELELIVAHKQGLLPTDFADKYYFITKASTEHCTSCNKVIGDKPHILTTTSNGVSTLCASCLHTSGIISTDKLYTKSVLDNAIASLKKSTNDLKKQMRKLAKEHNVEDIEKWIKKIDTVHVGVTPVMSSTKTYKCYACRDEIKEGYTYFTIKKQSFKTRRVQLHKLCLNCFENSIKSAIEHNARVFEEYKSTI